jgi:oligoribonuclease NrnB/cAMP/cGMP phosphodiesterase (DHH superfamily)
MTADLEPVVSRLPNVFHVHDSPEYKQSGCELTWDYFYGTTSGMSRAVYLLGRYDVWDLQEEENEVIPFQYAMRAKNTHPGSAIWDLLISDDRSQHVNDLIFQGRAIVSYVTVTDTVYAARCAFNALLVLNGKLRSVIVLNKYRTSSQAFNSVYDPARHDLMMCYAWTGNAWEFSLYTTKPEVNVGEIAKSFGGGGHPGAAGFIWRHPLLPFILEGVTSKY